MTLAQAFLAGAQSPTAAGGFLRGFESGQRMMSLHKIGELRELQLESSKRANEMQGEFHKLVLRALRGDDDEVARLEDILGPPAPPPPTPSPTLPDPENILEGITVDESGRARPDPIENHPLIAELERRAMLSRDEFEAAIPRDPRLAPPGAGLSLEAQRAILAMGGLSPLPGTGLSPLLGTGLSPEARQAIAALLAP